MVIGKKVHGNNVYGKTSTEKWPTENRSTRKKRPWKKGPSENEEGEKKRPHQGGKIVHILVNLFTRNLTVFVCTIQGHDKVIFTQAYATRPWYYLSFIILLL